MSLEHKDTNDDSCICGACYARRLGVIANNKECVHDWRLIHKFLREGKDNNGFLFTDFYCTKCLKLTRKKTEELYLMDEMRLK